jgi:hypothetical protein
MDVNRAWEIEQISNYSQRESRFLWIGEAKAMVL